MLSLSLYYTISLEAFKSTARVIKTISIKVPFCKSFSLLASSIVID